MSINICCKLSDLCSKETIQIDLPDTSFNTSVEVLRQLITSQLKITNEFDLVSYGLILKDDKALASYGIKGNTTIYVFKKRDVSPITCITAEAIEASKASQSKPEASEVGPMATALKMALRSAEFRTMLTKLNNREDREKLMAFTPGLREDPIVLAILQDPELINLCVEDSNNFAHVVQRHPILAEAAENLAATFHEEHPNSHFSTGNQPRYGLDDSDDDDEEEGAAAAPAPQPASADVISRMLREALNNANSALQQRGQQSRQSSSTTQPTINEPTSRNVTEAPQNRQNAIPLRPTPPVITSTMLQHALSMVNNQLSTTQPDQQSLPQSIPAPVPNRVSRPPPSSASGRSTIRNWTNELTRLRELGITDETYSIQVLEATDGDVDAAARIILNENQ